MHVLFVDAYAYIPSHVAFQAWSIRCSWWQDHRRCLHGFTRTTTIITHRTVTHAHSNSNSNSTQHQHSQHSRRQDVLTHVGVAREIVYMWMAMRRCDVACSHLYISVCHVSISSVPPSVRGLVDAAPRTQHTSTSQQQQQSQAQQQQQQAQQSQQQQQQQQQVIPAAMNKPVETVPTCFKWVCSS